MKQKPTPRMSRRNIEAVKQRAAEVERQHAAWEERGRKAGLEEARRDQARDLSLQRQQANNEMLRALASLTENVARAIVTFVGEGGGPRS